MTDSSYLDSTSKSFLRTPNVKVFILVSLPSTSTMKTPQVVFSVFVSYEMHSYVTPNVGSRSSSSRAFTKDAVVDRQFV